MTTLAGQILRSDSDGRAYLSPGVVEIAEDRIVGVDFGNVSKKADFGNRKALICPG